MALWDTTALLAEIRRRCAAPASSSTAPGWDDASLLAFANGEIPQVADRLRRVGTGYFTVQKDQTFTAGQASYRIPSRASHGMVALVQRLDSSGVLQHLTKTEETEQAGRNPTTQGTPTEYWWRGNSIVLYPVPDNSTESLRFTYHRRPNQLVAVASAGVISSVSYPVDATKITINITGNTSTLGITTSTPLDIIRATPPFDSLLDDSTPIAVLTGSISLQPGAAVVAALRGAGDSAGTGGPGPAAGDYICLAQQAPVVQMPTQAFYVIAQSVACQLLSEEPPAQARAQRLLEMLEADLYGGAVDRDDAEPDSAANTVWP